MVRTGPRPVIAQPSPGFKKKSRGGTPLCGDVPPLDSRKFKAVQATWFASVEQGLIVLCQVAVVVGLEGDVAIEEQDIPLLSLHDVAPGHLPVADELAVPGAQRC